jgi:hypothetical protein
LTASITTQAFLLLCYPARDRVELFVALVNPPCLDVVKQTADALSKGANARQAPVLI